VAEQGDQAHGRDRALVDQVKAGSADALSRLYDGHAGRVFALARRIVARPEDAEEVVQDVFAQVWRDAGRYDATRSTVAGWIVMLARTRAVDRLRARHARPDHDRGVEPSPAMALAASTADPESATIAARDATAVRIAMHALPDSQRSLVELAYFEGLSHTELAERTGVPLGTVKTRLRTAMGALRMALSPGRQRA
jgi:RNA polymerase sigma-70 factor (ECF subfamily)